MVTITLAGPGKNALGRGLLLSILAGLDAAAGDPVLLTGDGGAFSAGLNLKEVATFDAPAMREFLALLERCMTALFLYPGPTAALVEGHAIAGGCVLTLCCDVRVAADDERTKIGLNEVALGMRFPPRTLAIVRQRIPREHHETVLLGAGLVSPREALRLGLLDEVTPDAGAVARARLQALAAHPRAAYAATKADLRGDAEGLCPDAEQRTRLDEALAVWTSDDVKRGVLAVLGKRG